ncbi:hypothetical protein C5167_037011 [Papaver somniferum]|uniref:Uncharacterized protein n=1 Tax=Papaver somniferum TaxID=3469 RepID=A0A4Y7I9J3_PAPSO|nr:hypothetical protein C5167_037011 [Papaver somniferum]
MYRIDGLHKRMKVMNFNIHKGSARKSHLNTVDSSYLGSYDGKRPRMLVDFVRFSMFEQALYFLAGANLSFTGEKILATPNNDVHSVESRDNGTI